MRYLRDAAGVTAPLQLWDDIRFTLVFVTHSLVVEGVIFRTIENKTVRRWGMQHG